MVNLTKGLKNNSMVYILKGDKCASCLLDMPLAVEDAEEHKKDNFQQLL